MMCIYKYQLYAYYVCICLKTSFLWMTENNAIQCLFLLAEKPTVLQRKVVDILTLTIVSS